MKPKADKVALHCILVSPSLLAAPVHASRRAETKVELERSELGLTREDTPRRVPDGEEECGARAQLARPKTM